MPSTLSSSLRITLTAAALAAPLFASSESFAQYPPQQVPPQQYPPQQYPPQQYPPQQYPPQQYPPQQYPPQQYPPQQYPPQQYPPQQYPGGYPPGVMPPPAASTTRSPDEMVGLYVTSGLYGVGSGIWLDSLFKLSDPGPAVIMPILLGAAAPVGVLLWDSQGGPLHRGVPSSIATGLVLGAVEGIAIDGVQWQYNREKNKDWNFSTQTTITWIMATGGGVGGWAFGEWLRPDPRSASFILSGAGWGSLSGAMLGIAVSGKDWKDGASVAGLIGYNVGFLGAGGITIAHTASYESQKWMWAGYGLGAGAGCLVFIPYLFSSDDAKHGFIGPALGGLAGMALAGVFTWNTQDTPAHAGMKFKPPFNLTLSQPPPHPAFANTNQGGTMFMGVGEF